MQALKDVALRLLNVYVSPYVENLNSHDLSLSVFGGNLQFHALHLKKSLLERFGLPVEIVAGDIGTLSVTIPWTQLKTQPVKITIDDVYVLARARPQGKVDPEEDERVEQATKQEKLRSAEAVDRATSQVGGVGDDETKQTYIGAIISKVVDNVQIHVKGIHIRYEDGTNTPDHPFATGITLDEFKAVSTDENWVEAFIQDGLKGVHKLVKLAALSVYFDTDTGSLDKGDRQGTIDALKHMLSGPGKHQYILKPVTGEARLIVNKTMSNEIPKVDGQIIFDEIGLVLDRDQYRDALSVLDVFHFYRRTHQYHKFRPPEAEIEANPARARLKFALNAIAAEVRDRNRRWTWEYLSERRDMRKKYVEVYVKRLALPEGKPLQPEDAKILSDMEEKLLYEDIRFFRSVARAQAKKDAATRRKMDAERKKEQAGRQTWGQWIWGGGPKDDSEDGMSQEEKKELDDIIDYDAATAADAMLGDQPKDFMKARISARLNKGSFSLRADPHGRNSDVIALVFDSFTADATQYTEAIAAKVALGGFRVYDGTMPGSLYPQIVRVKDIESGSSRTPNRQTSLDVGGTDVALAEIGDGLPDSADPFFVMELEHNPLDGRADNAVTVKMRHLEIIYHKGYVEAVVDFLKPPESQLESIGALLDAAGQTLDGLQKQTRAGLEYALDQHKTVDIRVDMNAPIIIIPMNVTETDCQALVLDAGHIAIESKLADQTQVKEVQSKRGKQYSNDDYRQLEDLMYDRLSLRLESTQLLMGGNVESCLQALDAAHIPGGAELHILERINMNFSVQNAIVNTSTLTRFKIAGELPELQVNFSDRKYKTLMRFIDIAVPSFGDDAAPEQPSPVVKERRNTTFRPPPIEEYNLDDNRSIRSLRTVDSRDDEGSIDEKGEKFYEAQDDTTESQRSAMQQVSFEFSFRVGKLQASLFKAVSEVEEKALADAVLEGFGLTFALRKYDMSVDLHLRNVTLAMIEQGLARKPLLSSAETDASAASVPDLVRVRYFRVQKDSPEFMTKHEGVDQSIVTELSTFKITVAPEPILALNDFIMTTFVPSDEQPPLTGPDKPDAGKSTADAPQPVSSDKIRIRVHLTSAQVSLENNGIAFALLALPSADVALMLRAGTMRVSARLGNLSLEDLTEDEVADPSFKKILAIEGDELADFSYETFDPADKQTFPGYNSSVNLRAGSLRFTFMEATVASLYGWALKFARLKAVYDTASQAAVQRASEVTRIHYDVTIKTPIVVLPRDGLISQDMLVLRLGEIFAKNKYLGDPNDTATIEAGLRGISVSSDMMYDGKQASLKMVDDVAISATIKQAGGEGHRSDPKNADMQITTEMSDVKMSLTQPQYVLLMAIVESLPRALTDVAQVSEAEESAPPSTEVSTGQVTPATPTSDGETQIRLQPELVVAVKDGSPASWTTMDLEFSVNSITLEVYTDKAIAVEDLERNSLARFGLMKTHVGLKQLSDGAMEAEFSLKTIAFTTTRSGSSVFRDIIPPASHDGNQVMLQYTKSGGANGSALAIATIDSPKIILAVEPLAALLEFAVSPFKNNAPAESPDTADTPDHPANREQAREPGSLSFRVEVIQSTVMVIADDTDPKSQAIQLQVKEVLLSQQTIMALKIGQLGMSFGRMDKLSDRITFLDRLNVALSLDTKRRGSQVTTSFDVDIPDPIIFRASYSDIMLILDIVNKATSATTKAMSADTAEVEPARRGSIGDRRTSLTAPKSDKITESTTAALVPKQSARRPSVAPRRSSIDKAKVLVSKEQLTARIKGFQLVLVGGLQEMPFVHLATNEFQVAINDWSGDMKMATSITTSIRYYNPSNSYFEPLMDPWKFDLRVTRVAGLDSSPMDVRLIARERLELNVSAAFIELAMTGVVIGEGQARQARGTDAPFRIRNQTGLKIAVWPESRDTSKTPTGVKELNDGADVPWRFEDKHRARDNVSAARHNSLGVHIQNSDWDPLRSISVDREGPQILALRPKIDKVSHQLMCDIKVENNIKVITFRSTFNVENNTALPIEMIIVDAHGKASTGQIKIAPGESHPLPLTAAYEKRFRLRPLKGFNFDYSWSMPLHWRQLVARPIRPISCKHQTEKKPAFYFQGKANFDENDPAAKMYPRMTLSLRAPVELENLLPYDIRWRVHDKNTGLSSGEYLIKGGACPLHTVELSHLLLISIGPQECNFQQSEYAIINTDDPELPIEDHLQVTDKENIPLMLRIHYFTYPDSGGAIRVQIYAPYVFLNKTGLPFDLAAKGWSGAQREVAGRADFAGDCKKEQPSPFMFNFPNSDRRDRLLLRVADSKWSKPMSFDSPSANMAVVMPSSRGDREMHVGLSYTEGLGKYKLTKVVTLTPRFLVVNNFEYPIRIRQEQSEQTYDIAKGAKVPVQELLERAPAQFTLTADLSTQRWSAPFNADDIGRTHLVVQRQASSGVRTYLLRVETHIQGSSFFIYISREKEPWPLKLRNDTNLGFSFQQTDSEKRSNYSVRDLPATSSVDYSWDRPTVGGKRVRLMLDGVPLGDPIDMMAIGVQRPMKTPRQPGKRSSTVSIDIQADGASQLLVISPYDEETSIYKPAKPGGPRRSESTDSISTMTTQFETVHIAEKPNMTVTVDFEGIGISLITKKPDELIYVSLRGLSIGYADFSHYYDAFVDCKWIQIDNQLFGGLFPIILYPQVIPKDGKDLESHPTLQASVAILKDQSHGVVFIKYATVLLQSLTVEIDEDFLFALLDFTKFKGAGWEIEPESVLIEHPGGIPEPDIHSGQADFFFETLHLQPLALNLSFMRTDRVNVDEKVSSSKNPFYYAFNALTMALGNVNDAPIKFTQLLLENTRLSIPSLTERITLHYQGQVVPQIYRVLGSADFLGNPMGLFTQVSSGVSDIFYEPYQGVVMHGNKDIGLGIARGASSFAKKTVFGITDSMTKFTGSIGKGLSAATMDAEYQTRRRMNQRRNKPRHALYGVAAGASAFADSVTSAFEGVASKPMEGAERDGASGFVKGVGKGFVGLVTKPVVGIFDFMSTSTEGIRNTTTVFDQDALDKARLSRYIASDGVIRPYSEREALGQSWLKDLRSGEYRHEAYVAHLDIPGDDAVALLSNQRLLLMQLRKMKVIWDVPLSEMQSLSLEESGIGLVLRGGQSGPFLPISDRTGRDWLFKNIGKVVNQYNRRHAARDDY